MNIPLDIMDIILEYKEDLELLEDKKELLKELSEDIKKYHRYKRYLKYKEIYEFLFFFTIVLLLNLFHYK